MVFWHWWVLAVVLLIIEVFSPMAYFMWMALAAVVVGFLMLLIPSLSWEWQFLSFALFSVMSIVVGKNWFKRHPIESEQPMLNTLGAELVGRTFTVDEPIVNGQGRVKVGETTWKVRGPDCKKGAAVTVVDVDSAVLIVEVAK